MWGCKEHWFTLPKFLRDEIWLRYVAGQEVTKTPSHEYIVIAELTRLWIDNYIKTGVKLSEKAFFGEHLEKLRSEATNPR